MRPTIAHLLLVASTTGCISTMPTAFGESTDALAAHQVSVTVLGGGGAMAGTCSGCSGALVAGGGELRVRYGIDGKQEIGVSGFGTGTASTQGGSGLGSGGGEISYKVAPMRRLALVAGFGFIDIATLDVTGVGGDIGVLVAPYMGDNASVYTGARGALVGYPSGKGGWSESITLPIGVSIGDADRVRFFVEGGLLMGWEQFNGSPSTNSNIAIGGYGAVAIQFTIGERPK
jgi:hypothetical protein